VSLVATQCWNPPHLPTSQPRWPLALQAMVTLFLCIGLSALLPAIEYAFILRHDSNVNIAYAAAIWAGCAITFLFGLAAYQSMMPILLGAHAALVCISGSAMVVSYTMVYFSADTRCYISQNALKGCSACSCAVTNSCNTVWVLPLMLLDPMD
jgi:hypothetical protein